MGRAMRTSDRLLRRRAFGAWILYCQSKAQKTRMEFICGEFVNRKSKQKLARFLIYWQEVLRSERDKEIRLERIESQEWPVRKRLVLYRRFFVNLRNLIDEKEKFYSSIYSSELQRKMFMGWKKLHEKNRKAINQVHKRNTILLEDCFRALVEYREGHTLKRQHKSKAETFHINKAQRRLFHAWRGRYYFSQLRYKIL